MAWRKTLGPTFLSDVPFKPGFSSRLKGNEVPNRSTPTPSPRFARGSTREGPSRPHPCPPGRLWAVSVSSESMGDEFVRPDDRRGIANTHVVCAHVPRASMDRIQRLFSNAGGGGLGGPPADAPMVDTAEQVYISSLALLKMLKHGTSNTCVCWPKDDASTTKHDEKRRKRRFEWLLSSPRPNARGLFDEVHATRARTDLSASPASAGACTRM